MTIAVPELIEAAAGAATAPAGGAAASSAAGAPAPRLFTRGRPSSPPARSPRPARMTQRPTRPAPSVGLERPAPGQRRRPVERRRAPERSGQRRASGHHRGGLGAGLFHPPRGKTYHRAIMAEYILVIVIIAATPILAPQQTDSNGKPVQQSFARPLVRLTAASALFFVLALAANNPKSGRVAAAFGGLAVLGAAFNATSELDVLGHYFAGKGQQGGAGQQSTASTASTSALVTSGGVFGTNPSQNAGGIASPDTAGGVFGPNPTQNAGGIATARPGWRGQQ